VPTSPPLPVVPVPTPTDALVVSPPPAPPADELLVAEELVTAPWLPVGAKRSPADVESPHAIEAKPRPTKK
jgi:hypothetical protein